MTLPIFGIAAFVGVCGVSFYFGFINIYKRLRDIRGSTENQAAHQIFVTIGFIIPVVSIFVAIWLMFMPGKITSLPEKQPEMADDFQNVA